MSVMPFEFMETVILQLTNLRVGDGGGRWGWERLGWERLGWERLE